MRVKIPHTRVKKDHASPAPDSDEPRDRTGSRRRAGKLKKVTRPVVSRLRAGRSPRILFHACDLPPALHRDLALARSLLEALDSGCVLLATAANVDDPRLTPHLEIADLPRMPAEAAARPLALARVRRLRTRRLATLFDVFQPELVLIDPSGPEARTEALVLLERARAFGAASQMVSEHEPAEETCASTDGRSALCERCRERNCQAVRWTLALDRARDWF
jgi:hypothetical protein